MADPLTIVTAVGAGIAIAQPWLMQAWSRWLRPARMDAHLLGTVEIGFGPWGPAIGLVGTLRAVDGDVFVGHIELRVTREKDGASHDFAWYVFRPHALPVSHTAQQQGYIEFASAFMVVPRSPHQFNIVFADVETKREIDATLRSAYEALADERAALGLSDPGLQRRQGGTTDPSTWEDLRRRFLANSKTMEAFAGLTQLFYWKSGGYKLSMTISSSRPDRDLRYEFRFELADENSKSLNMNISNILSQPFEVIAGSLGSPVSFAYVPLITA